MQIQREINNFETYYEFAPVGYFDLDENIRIIKVNLTGVQMLGVPRSRLIGKSFFNFISKNDQSLFYIHLQQVFSAKMKFVGKLQLLKATKVLFYTQIESILLLEGVNQTKLIRLSVIDIDEYRLTEQELRSSEEKFRSIVETTKKWIWSMDTKGRFLYSNPAVVGILGYTPAELINRNHLLFICKEDRSIMNKLFPHCVKEKAGWSNMVLRWRSKTGNYHYLESTSVPFFNVDGKLAGFRGTHDDITLRKEMEDQSRFHQILLSNSAKINSLGELASSMAHELTQPLTAINNYVSGCIKKIESASGYKKSLILEALVQAAAQTERAGQIIHRIKDFAKKGRLHFDKVYINEIIQESVALVKREFFNNPVNIHVDLPLRSLEIMADKIQLEQVVINLLRNGIEVMINHETLNPEIEIKCDHYSNRQILISIKDNGPGCSLKTDIDKIFEVCFTTKINGLGMGLAISRTIIEAHHGKITAKNNAHDKGMCFQFLLPFYQTNDGLL